MTDPIETEARELLARAYDSKPGYEGNAIAVRAMHPRYPDSMYICPLAAVVSALRERNELREAARAVVFGCSRYEHDKGNKNLALAVVPVAQGFSGQTFSLGDLRCLAALLAARS